MRFNMLTDKKYLKDQSLEIRPFNLRTIQPNRDIAHLLIMTFYSAKLFSWGKIRALCKIFDILQFRVSVIIIINVIIIIRFLPITIRKLPLFDQLLPVSTPSSSLHAIIVIFGIFNFGFILLLLVKLGQRIV